MATENNGNEKELLMKAGEVPKKYRDGDWDPASPPPAPSSSAKGLPLSGYEETDAPLLAQFHEDAIHQAGVGNFHWLLLFVSGLGLAADTVELLVVAYILPSAEVELCLSSAMKGWLAAVTFIGMMIGAVIWGALGDCIGRRSALLSALLVNAVFGLAAAFTPSYGLFLLARLCSGLGIGGGIPIVFAYFCEFIEKRKRGRYLSWLLTWWAVGGVFTAVTAWCIMPRTGLSIFEDEQHTLGSWRVLLAVCSVPAFAAALGLYFMPESPRYLLEQGRDVEAIIIYKKIYSWNHVSGLGDGYLLSELELPASRPRPARPRRSGLRDALDKLASLYVRVLRPPYLHTTLTLLVVWFASAFGFYGLSVWFPEYIKLLKSEEYDKNATVVAEAVFMSWKFNVTRLENVRFVNTTFNNVTFENMVLNHVKFEDCSVFDCTFSQIRSSKTYFRNTYVAKNEFLDTDFYEYRFQNCDMKNNVFRTVPRSCTLDFDYNIHYKDVFQENLIGQLSLIPGTLLASLAMDSIGRARMMGLSFILSGLAAFFIWFLDSKIGIIIFEAMFNFIFIAGWNALDIGTTESYPAHVRTSAYGLLSAVSRVGGILGTLSFGYFIDLSRAAPVLAASLVLLLGGAVALTLPDTRDRLM